MADDPTLKFLRTFDHLRERKRWTSDKDQLRFVALSLASLDLPDPHAALESTARKLRDKSGWFGPMNSQIRYAVAAMILGRRLPPGRVHDRMVETRKRFRGRGLPWGEGRKTIAALLLVLHHRANRVPESVLVRMAGLYRLWKADHRWLTGQDDYPMLALHSLRDEPLPLLAARVEDVYRGLRGAGLSTGNQLQLASHLLCALPGDASKSVRRFVALKEGFEREGEKIRCGFYDEVALLALTPDPPRSVVRRVIATRDRLREEKPKPTKAIAFSLAAGLELRSNAAMQQAKGAAEVAAIQAAQAALEAQQAAMVACIGAASAASTGGG